MDITIKTVANKSKTKVNIIHAIDRKIPLEDIAKANNLTQHELMAELDMIVQSGTKIKLDYFLQKNIDEYVRDTIIDYFKQSQSDSIDEAYKILKEDDIAWEEIQLMRLKFISDYAN
jgi:ATP-dependent DNA helicase RecQ